ncbi:hypothetical protein ACQKO7_23910, partial [Pseudomonas putida]|uniref:hypothetical protein n=1 Tax=Pseudomonas putida TaxID=303 RepID=UPI003D083B5E
PLTAATLAADGAIVAVGMAGARRLAASSPSSSRCAARAALDLTASAYLKTRTFSYILQRSIPQPAPYPLPYSAVHSLK